MAVWCCSDLHGRADILREISAHLNQNDTLYFLGDASDRQEDNLETLFNLLTDPRVIFIKGNHEMFIQEWFYYRENRDWRVLSEFENFWTDQGGGSTIESLLALDCSTLNALIQCLESLPLRATYTSESGIVWEMSHSGFWGENEDELLQNRSHFEQEEVMEPRHIRIHGHTPIPYLRKRIGFGLTSGGMMGRALWYNDGVKCCIDNQACQSGAAILLNLDTFDERLVGVF